MIMVNVKERRDNSEREQVTIYQELLLMEMIPYVEVQMDAYNYGKEKHL